MLIVTKLKSRFPNMRNKSNQQLSVNTGFCLKPKKAKTLVKYVKLRTKYTKPVLGL